MTFQHRYAILGVLIISLLCGCSHGRYGGKTAAEMLPPQQASGMNQADDEKFLEIRTRLVNGDAPSIKDIDWLLGLADRPGTAVQRANRGVLVGSAFEVIKHSKIPPSRRDAIFDFAKHLSGFGAVPDGLGAHGGCQIVACNIFNRLQDRKALPYLSALSNYPDPLVRMRARQTIRRINKLRIGALG